MTTPLEAVAQAIERDETQFATRDSFRTASAVIATLHEDAYERLRVAFGAKGQQFGADTLQTAIDAILGEKQ